MVEKALEAEMAYHLGHGKNEPVENPAGNTRNASEYGCVLKGISKPGMFPTITELDVTLSKCSYPGFNRQMTAALLPEFRRIPKVGIGRAG